MTGDQRHIAHDPRVLYAFMEAALDAIVVSDADGTIIRANPATAKLFGYDLNEMLGRNVRILMPQALADLHDGFMAYHLTTGQKRIIGMGREVEGQTKDGRIFPLHLSVGETEVEGDRLFVAILHNLSHQAATQEALARSQRLDAIGQLTGGIAHDFNNLLTVVMGNLELVETRTLDDRHLSLIRDALASAELGAELTARLMIFAKKTELKPVRADLRALCNDAFAILKRTVGAMYSIETQNADHVSPVKVDTVQMQSALIKLAVDARDAMPTGGQLLISVADVTIDDSYMAQETDIHPGDYVRLSVSDDGEGMTLEAQRRAFEPFFTTKSDTGGTGLGLAMVYGFVRQSGGHVTLYSELGHGTSFGLYFPVARDLGQATADDPARLEGIQTPRGLGQTVLVVEDNPRGRRLSIERLRDLGYNTEEAESGDIAYDLLAKGTAVDLVFSDLVMPGKLNGYDLAARVNQEFPEVKVLLTSGYASDVVTGKMGGSDRYDVLHKPYRQTELAHRLQALLGSGGSAGPHSPSHANL